MFWSSKPVTPKTPVVCPVIANVAWRNWFDLITNPHEWISWVVVRLDQQNNIIRENQESHITSYNALKTTHEKKLADLAFSTNEKINSSIQAKQKAEHNLELAKQRLLVLEWKESKEQEYRDRIQELEVQLAVSNSTVAWQMQLIQDRNIELEQLNKRIDNLTDSLIELKNQEVKVIAPQVIKPTVLK